MSHRAVFFDFGGTLFSYRAIRHHFDALLDRMARRHGIRAERSELRRIYRATMAKAFLEYESRPFYLHRELFRDAHLAFLRELGADPEPPAGDLFYEAQSALGLARVSPRSDASETLQALRERGLHLAIVSNIDDDQFGPLWEQLGLAPFFHATTTSEQARSCKPDPEIFRLALAKAGDPKPEQVVFVGDSVQHDVAGAACAGLITVLLSGTMPTEGPKPDYVISELHQLLEIVQS